MRRLGYLASPYMHKKAEVREQRFREIAYIAAQIMSMNDHVICPITMCHPMATSEQTLPGDFHFWRELDESLISRCDYLLLTPLDGWLKSMGMKAEVAIAQRLNKEILMVKLDENLKVLGYEHYKGELNG